MNKKVIKKQSTIALIISLGLLVCPFAAGAVTADSGQLSATGSSAISNGVILTSLGATSVVHAILAAPATIADDINSVGNDKTCLGPCEKGFPIADEIITFSPEPSADE